MVSPAHENSSHEEFDRIDAEERIVSFTGTDGKPWSLRALPAAASESPLSDQDLSLWVIEDNDGLFQDVLILPEVMFTQITFIAQNPPLFSPGSVTMTPGAADALKRADVLAETLLVRHERGDWGELSAEDNEANREALRTGNRILSSYTLPKTNETIWVVTEGVGNLVSDSGLNTVTPTDRDATTLLLPSDY